ncbi:MAG: HAD family hydrolase [Pseudomonadales bacterium]
MEPIRILALDLDGTLALPDHKVSERTRAALHELHNDGVAVTIATGRRYRSARYVMENLGLETYCVCNGGALVKDPAQNTLSSTPFAEDQYQVIVDCARKSGVALSAQRDAHMLGGSDFVIDNAVIWNHVNHRYFTDNQDNAISGDLLAHPDQYLVFGAYDSEPKLRQMCELIAAQAPDLNTILVSLTESDFYYCEITLNIVDKWHGLSHLLGHLDLNANNVCAVGDELNDVAMVRAAAHGVAMANGHDELKSIANFVCGHNEEDGLLHVVDYIRDHNGRSLA